MLAWRAGSCSLQFADALRMPMAKLPEYRSNMQYLGAAPVDNGDEAPMRPMVRQ
jgi:hypothetical protein